MYLPVNGYAQEKSSCLQPILQHTSTSYKHTFKQSMLWKHSTTLGLQQSRCKIYEGRGQPEYQIHVGKGLTSHFTRTTENLRMYVQSRKACSRHANITCPNILESGDCSAFYKYVNLRRIHRDSVAPLVNKHDDLATSNNEKADVLNSQFSSVFTTDDGTVPFLTHRTDAQLFSVDINPERVRKFMCKLPTKFSRSPDGIPTAVLKILSCELCIPLHIIFKT